MDAASDVLNAAPPAERKRIECALARFARDARALLGFERLPEPVIAWATWSEEGEPGLNRLVAEGRLVFRRWEGELSPFRRRPLKETLETLLAPLCLGNPVRETAEPSSCEWRGSFRDGRFTRVSGSVSSDGKTVRFALEPALEQPRPETAHEGAADVLLEASLERSRPPGATALPCPLRLPAGGRFPRRLRSPRKRRKR